MKPQAALVVNTASRKGRDCFKEAQILLTQTGLEFTPYPINNPDNLSSQVKKLVKDGVKLLIIGGGDGTVSEIVDHLAHTDVVLGILPLGTANSFSRSLNIPADLAEAVQVIAGGKTAKVDLGKINDDYFANAVSIGFASTIAENIPHLLKRYFGIVAYGIQCIRNLGKLKPFKVTLAGEITQQFETYQIVIANGGFYGPAPLVAKKGLQSANLSIFTFKSTHPLHILRIWLRSLAGAKFSEQDTEQIKITKEVTLTASPKQSVSIDGEIKTETPIRISVAPQALIVLIAEDSKLQP